MKAALIKVRNNCPVTVNFLLRLTSVFLVATSVGAQAFKIPLASRIEEEPQFLMSALAAATAFLLVTYAVSFAMALDLKA